ncbi:MAG: phosphohistidine phosphatase SixA [Planctomycetota bacterium]
MNVYLVQHGEARSKEEDPDRHLTDEGVAHAEKIARFLEPRGVPVAAVWHSGKTRAEQTAGILASGLAVAEGVTERDGLGPNDDVRAVADALSGSGADVMIVGHMPFMDKLASLLVAGDASAGVVEFQNAGVVCIGSDEDGGWRVRWIVTPALLA